jgi:murein DD-endopeptidase MepM/ murein hydrolase activator NlpD
MACKCPKVERTTLWTPIPEFKQPTDILPGENIDCYARRAGNKSGLMDDVTTKIANKLNDTSLTSDLKGAVDKTFRLTPTSDKVATAWEATVNGQPLNIPGVTFDPNTGRLSGTVAPDALNKAYKVLVKAKDSTNSVIDSREFNFIPKGPVQGEQEETIKFIFPYDGPKRITSGFGPRNVKEPPGATKNHSGIDIAGGNGQLNNILASADGVVTRAGPASGYGNVVYIAHNNSRGELVATTVYGHMSETYVRVGQRVSAGQVIAKEGSEGVSSGPHLHFELHKGGPKNPVDPVPYLQGEAIQANDGLPDFPGQPDPGSFEPVQNGTEVGMTGTEASTRGDCPEVLPNQAPPTGPSNPEPPAVPQVPTTSPDRAATQAAIQRALNEDPSLTAEDKKLLQFMAKIESNYDADAKNPTSSARGVYQMLDRTADKYYRQIGVEPTLENRNDPYLATKAQVAFYKTEQQKYWNEFQESGRTKIAGKTLSPEVQARYANLTQGEFIYGLVHHDGVGNAVKGQDMQGLDYYRRKVRETTAT